MILGIVGAEDSLKLLNLMNIAIKYYIYTCRCNNGQPTAPSAIGQIKELHNIEHSIAVKNNSLDQHKSKWELLESLL